MNLILSSGIIISSLILAVLLSKKKKLQSDRVLTLWLLLWIVHIAGYYLEYSGIAAKNPVFLGIIVPLPLVHGPFLFLYCSSLLNRRFRAWFHFIPTVAFYAFMVPFFLMKGEDKLLYVQSVITVSPPLFFRLFFGSIFLSGPVYIFLSYYVLRKYQKGLKAKYSSLEEEGMRWISKLIIGMSFIWVTIIISVILERNFNLPFENYTDPVIFISVSIFLFLMAFFGIRQTRIFIPEQNIPERDNTEKYQKSSISPSVLDQGLKRIQDHMAIEKPYLNSKLNLSELAGQLSMTTHHLSQIINQGDQRNFFDFINEYRVEEFKRRVINPEWNHLTLLGLALDCGFNSKSSFNSIFKKNTGLTPSEFRKKLKESQIPQVN